MLTIELNGVVDDMFDKIKAAKIWNERHLLIDDQKSPRLNPRSSSTLLPDSIITDPDGWVEYIERAVGRRNCACLTI